MTNFAIEVECSRAISRQIIRHRSFHFQEFSLRYASIDNTRYTTTEARRQDLKNRQNSIDDIPEYIQEEWQKRQQKLNCEIRSHYQWALDKGIAKECARAILPEGNTKTILCMNGTVRSWIHYLELRCGNGTQKEHMEVANLIKDIFIKEFPIISEALGWLETE